MTFSLAAILLAVTTHTVLPGATGELVWVPYAFSPRKEREYESYPVAYHQRNPRLDCKSDYAHKYCDIIVAVAAVRWHMVRSTL